MLISDGSSDVCSSDLRMIGVGVGRMMAVRMLVPMPMLMMVMRMAVIMLVAMSVVMTMSVPMFGRAPDADALDMVVMALLRQADLALEAEHLQIGRAACRARGRQYV